MYITMQYVCMYICICYVHVLMHSVYIYIRAYVFMNSLIFIHINRRLMQSVVYAQNVYVFISICMITYVLYIYMYIYIRA